MGSLTSQIPPEIVARFSELFPDHEDVEDVLQDQECVYQSFQLNRTGSRVSPSTGNGVPISRSGSMDSELDRAIALSLEYVDYDFEIASTSDLSCSATDSGRSRGSSSTTEISVALTQDDIDPDNMTYEELQSLTDTIGNESKGVRKELLSSLPSQKFKGKLGWFNFKKSNAPECMVCFMEYKKGERLTTLPCMHQYHEKCIKRWLSDHKTCPICKNEVSQ